MTAPPPPPLLRLSSIRIYPIKSLDSLEVESATLTAAGGLLGDRQFALFDREGKFVNSKRTDRLHPLRTSYAPDLSWARFASTAGTETFSLADDRSRLADYLSTLFGKHVELREQVEGGFPDDTDAPGPTVISTATLAAVAGWFPGLSLENVRDRFRTNLELAVPEPFWEDRLYATAGSVVRFRVGSVMLGGTNPCQRCVVPSRDPQTGDVWPRFTPQFAALRERHLPPWAERSRFNHFYRLAVNTRLVEAASAGQRLTVGDTVELLDEQLLASTG